MISKVPAQQVFSDALVVLDLPNWSSFAMLQCSFHELWVRRESSSMKKDIRYTPSDSFDTYPFLHTNSDKLEKLGEEYYKLRQKIMITRNEGLTKTYNHFHNSDEKSRDIQELRKLHESMDKGVTEVYGWKDINLNHDFYNTKHGIRYKISEEAQHEVLKRLLELNHELYEKELKRKSVVKKSRKTSKKKQDDQSKEEEQLNLFN
ncbi:hypothetical protein JCM19039_2116 [Geomicrobium sp. JCM 19039]|nr:hypothetical protein JCM19039_2116 [Geomicrobium sp. JCM 19039]